MATMITERPERRLETRESGEIERGSLYEVIRALNCGGLKREKRAVQYHDR